MINQIYTIGFTQKTAHKFFELLETSHIDIVIDIRRNNTSQLSGFAKYPDIEYFLKAISKINYKHDLNFAPEETTLKKYKNKQIDWEDYLKEFNTTMQDRNIIKYISDNYAQSISYGKLCLLCSESESTFCHRSLIANLFKQVNNELEIIHL